MKEKRVQCYVCKARLIPARRYVDVWRVAWRIYKEIKAKTKRRTYVRSAYFSNQKIFFDYFWEHLKSKHNLDRLRRLRYFECSIELIKNSKIQPMTKSTDPLGKMALYRFMGKADRAFDESFFIVQIKEDLKRGQKFFMSLFPFKK